MWSYIPKNIVNNAYFTTNNEMYISALNTVHWNAARL